MAKNVNLTQAKRAKNDEFYTQYSDIEKEVFAYIAYNPDVFRDKTILCPCDDYEWSNFTKYFTDNFQKFGLKKLISTCYDNSGILLGAKGKIQIATKDGCKNGLLEGDGDFRSAEVTRLRDEADIVITNPPFSLFREFVSWIFKSNKKFLIIGHQNAITYKEIFPLVKENKIWLGIGFKRNATHFISQYQDNAIDTDHREGMIRVSGVIWLTNIEHSCRHKPIELMTMFDNIKHSKHKEIQGSEYKYYDNYNAIDVPFTDAIPSDYAGVMGVPVSFMYKYCPEQFQLIGHEHDLAGNGTISSSNSLSQFEINGKGVYKRILIKHKQPLLTK